MSDHHDDFYDDGAEECWNCGGDGGYAICQEDCCPHIYGEEGCTDSACWRRCSVCRGKGFVGGDE
jgi:hypothetical protein